MILNQNHNPQSRNLKIPVSQSGHKAIYFSPIKESAAKKKGMTERQTSSMICAISCAITERHSFLR